MMKYVALFLFALFSTSLALGGINSVVTSIGDYQSPDVGGFQVNRYTAPTMEDTSDALFLSSLFGLSDKINLVGVSKFVQSLRNLDGGYCNQPGAISDVASTRNAIASLPALGATVDEKQTASIASFLDTLYDAESKLFSARKGVVGDIRSTATVFECYQRLGLATSASVVEKQLAMKKFLQNLVRTDSAGRKYFYSITADNANAVIAASLVGFDFGNVQAWTSYFQDRQVQEGFWKGGFYSDSDKVDVTAYDAMMSLLALSHLEKKLVTSIDTASLVAFSNTLPADLRIATQAYRAITKSQGFSSLFKMEPVYLHREARHRVIGSRIVTGSQIKPSLIVRSNFGISQSSLNVKVDITYGGKTQSIPLVWDPENQVYVGEEFFSAENKLGPVSIDYSAQWSGENNALVLQSPNSLSIGYWSNIKLKSTYAGLEVEPNTGAIVDQGASFVLTATYGTTAEKPNAPLKSGAFDVTFSVEDSSSQVISTTTLDGAKGKPFKFNYLLHSADIPSGQLTLRVSVKDKNQKIVHTEDVYTFMVQSQMVAAELSFAEDKNNFKIGDNVQVSMVPANLPDLRTVQPLKKVARKVNLVVQASESTEALLTVPGTFQEATGHYSFAFVIPATFDAIGSHSITFTYEAANGDRFPLKLFNSKTNYLYDVGDVFSYTVDTSLIVTDDKSAPKAGQLQYGNDIKFTFKVYDEVSKQNIWAGTQEATAYLVLRHDEGKPSAFTSIKQSIGEVNHNYFAVDWAVNPNALKGPAVLALVAQAADGSEVPLLTAAHKPWTINVEIGGDISVTQQSYSGKLNDDQVSFFVEFELSCQQKKLKGAQLLAIVHLKDEESVQVPVAVGPFGRYQVSWLLNGKNAVSGDYKIDVYRNVDKKRNEAAEPFLSITHNHVPPATSPLPIRTEFVILIIFLGSFIWISMKKNEL